MATIAKSLIWKTGTGWTENGSTATTAISALATAVTLTATGKKLDASKATDATFTLIGSATNVSLFGGAGDDTLKVSPATTSSAWMNGGAGADILIGGQKSDTFALTGSFGADTLKNVGLKAAVDTIKFDTTFANLSFAAFTNQKLSLSVAGAGEAVIEFAPSTVALQSNAKFITTDKTFYVQTTNAHTVLNSTASTHADYMQQFSAITSATFVGGKNDTLIGGGVGDTFIYDKDIALINGGGGTDTIRLNTNATTTQTIDLTNSKYTSVEAVVVAATVTAGQVLRGLTTADQLTGSSGKDSIWSRGGNDKMAGGTGADTFWFAAGDGVDSITDNAVADKDVLKFVGFKQADISYAFTAGSLLVTYGAAASDIAIVQGNTEASKKFSIITDDKTFGVVTGATSYSGTTALTGAVGADYIRNFYTGDAPGALTVTFDGKGGADTMVGGSGADSFVYTSALAYVDGGAGKDVLGVQATTTLSAVTIDLYNNADKFLNIESVQGGLGADVLRGYASAAETLKGAAGNDALWSAGGNDSMDGGAGNDTYWFAAGDGNDSLTVSGEDKDVYKFMGVNYSALNFAKDADLATTLKVTYGSDTVSIAGFTSVTAMNNQVFAMADTTFHLITDQGGQATLSGGASNKDLIKVFGDTGLTLNGKGGADTVVGGAGDDTINFYSDLVSVDGGAGTNKLAAVAGTYGPLTMDLNDAKYTNIQLVDGGNGNDVIRGTAGAQTLTGGAGNDALWGAAGDDQLTGGAGVDTYWFTAGDGTDTITAPASSSDDALDVVKFYSVAGTANVTATLDGSDLNLSLADGSKLVLQSWSGTNKINKFTFDSGTYKLSDDAATWTKL